MALRKRAFFDFSIDNVAVGRVVFELFNDETPKTCENFRALCTGEKGISPLSERPLYYKGSIIHRSIEGFMIQGGDFTKRNGMGGESIYGSPFADEDLSRKLDSEGLLCMANKGPNTNGSQFFVTLRACPHLNGKHVVFGKVIKGSEVLRKIVNVPVDDKDRPAVPVVISYCGELELRTKPQQEAHIRKANAKKSENDEDDDDATSNDNDRKRTSEPRKRRRHRSRSPSDRDKASESESETRSRRHRKRKREKKNKKDRSPSEARSVVDEKKETEEEYDARLEREEKERLEAEKKSRLEFLKNKHQEDQRSENGVRFKGRGKMKFIDPEMQRRPVHRG